MKYTRAQIVRALNALNHRNAPRAPEDLKTLRDEDAQAVIELLRDVLNGVDVAAMLDTKRKPGKRSKRFPDPKATFINSPEFSIAFRHAIGMLSRTDAIAALMGMHPSPTGDNSQPARYLDALMPRAREMARDYHRHMPKPDTDC
jgi:hypothetical protein